MIADLPLRGVYLDIGANIGATVIAAAILRPDIRIFAFELVPDNADLLERNIAANSVKNCTVVRSAIGDREGSVMIESDGPWSQIGGSGIAIPATTLDRFVDEHLRGTSIDLIKIDVEGYEPNVLYGASSTIQRFCPEIFMELNSWTLLVQGYNPIEFSQYLIDSFEIQAPAGVSAASAFQLAHSNVVKYGCMFDIAMQHRPGAPIASPDSLRFGAALLDEVAALHDEVRAIRASTSWRITAPLRALKEVFRRSA